KKKNELFPELKEELQRQRAEKAAQELKIEELSMTVNELNKRLERTLEEHKKSYQVLEEERQKLLEQVTTFTRQLEKTKLELEHSNTDAATELQTGKNIHQPEVSSLKEAIENHKKVFVPKMNAARVLRFLFYKGC